MRRVVAALIVVGCGGEPVEQGDLIASTTMILSEQSGVGPSPLDGLLGRSISFEVRIADAVTTHAKVDSCRWTIDATEAPVAIASGADAELVQTGILDRLPAWDLELVLCEPASESSARLHADFEGLAVIAGCLELPVSAQVRDGDDQPRWTAFTGASCDATIYDQVHDRLFTAHDVTMVFARAAVMR